MPGSGNSIFRHFDFLQLYLSHSNTQYVKRQVILCSTTLVYHSNIKRCDLWVEILKTSNLGVYVDQHLTWKEHIKNISNKIAKNVGIIARSSYLLPQTIRIKLYYSLIFPYLTYCNVVWASNYESRLSRLVILQKRAIRVVARVSSREHTGPIFSHLKILNIEQIKTFQVGEFMYNYHHGLLPLAFRGFFKLGTEIHSYFTRNAGAYRPPFARSNTRFFSIKHVGSLTWNKIPPYIQLLPNVRMYG